jgi:hypothetical protein
MSNLPSREILDSSQDTKEFFNKYFNRTVSFPAGEIDAVVGFFLKNGFDESSAASTSIVLLNQARLDNISVFQLVDSLEKLSEVELSQVVAQILNTYREKTSLLGYRIAPLEDNFESRNILI